MNTRIEKDSLGSLVVPVNALYGAQTQRAVDNFSISGKPMPRPFIKALGLIKVACARANEKQGLLDPKRSQAIQQAAKEVVHGDHDAHFPIDVFQTGSGTSSNMNANEVIAHLAKQSAHLEIHPNDHVNMSQSSNDVIPTAIQISASILLKDTLFPGLEILIDALEDRAKEFETLVKTGRTHLMDAMPITVGQELHCFVAQLQDNVKRLENCVCRLHRLPIGGTAVGTGINAPVHFGRDVAEQLQLLTSIAFTSAENKFVGISSQDTIVELSGHLNTLAVSLMKIANDFRWMNSGPLAGLAEISLPAIQPGSSIMPGKINPVIPEAVAMVCAQVMGNHTTITIAGQSGNFQLNVMLPVIADNGIESIQLLGNACKVFARKAIQEFTVNQENIVAQLEQNPILITALNRVIGYEKGAEIAKKAYQEKRPILGVALEMTGLDEGTLRALLDPKQLTKGG